MLVSLAMMRCLPRSISEATSFPKETSLAYIQHHLLQANIIQKDHFYQIDKSGLFVGAGDRGRTGTVSLPLDFESSTSANSITPACANYYTIYFKLFQVLFLKILNYLNFYYFLLIFFE